MGGTYYVNTHPYPHAYVRMYMRFYVLALSAPLYVQISDMKYIHTYL